MPDYTAKASATINAPVEKVWEALTDPKLVKEWLFGTDMTVTAWEVGGQITYAGVWEGKPYQDKGVILEIVPQSLLVSSYWSAFSGLPDSPENYQRVIYALAGEGVGKTRVEITQEGSKTAEGAKHSEDNWNKVLGSMKTLLEK